jgi:hypothetical protein
VLKLQGISTDTYVGALECKDVVPILRSIAGDSMVIEFSDVDEAVRGARSIGHFVIVAGTGIAVPLLQAIGADVANTVAVIAAGPLAEGGPTAASIRSAGATAVLTDPTEESLKRLVKRGLEYRALRALELAHRIEGLRLRRRELDLLGHPPEHMTDDLDTFQAPPLPVGPTSVYNLEQASEDFERAYIDRVQHLCASSREAALHLDVSAATLARRLRREGGVVHESDES